MLLPTMVFFVLSFLVFVDEPLPAPALRTIHSLNGNYVAVLDPEAKRTKVFAQEGDQRTLLWSMPGWYRLAYLSNDGNHLVTGYDGLNLIPQDYDPDMVMLRFFNQGKLIKELSLKQLITNFASLQETVSHYYWGDYLGLDDQGCFHLKTLEGELLFDAATGARLRPEK